MNKEGELETMKVSAFTNGVATFQALSVVAMWEWKALCYQSFWEFKKNWNLNTSSVKILSVIKITMLV